jgi:tetratricopeptide (TPR) repeat protein
LAGDEVRSRRQGGDSSASLTVSEQGRREQSRTACAFFQKGNQSYEEGKFDQAIEEYEEILNLGIKDFKVFYNLGNAHFRQKQLGKAILNYRRALDLRPRDEDAQANLSYIKLYTLDKIEEQKINPLSNMLHSFLELWSIDEFAVLTSLFYSLSMGFGILMLFRGPKRYLRLGFVTLLILMVIFGSSLLARIYYESVDHGVVIAPEVQIRSGPGEDYILQVTGHEGLEFRLDGEAEGWYRISLPNGIRGWIPKDAAEII